MKITHHRESSTITYRGWHLDHLSMMTAYRTSDTVEERDHVRWHQKVIKVRKAHNGTLVISCDGKPLNKFGMTSTLSRLDKDTLLALNDVLDRYDAKDFTEAECQSCTSGFESYEENLRPAIKAGHEALAVRTILRVAHAQMPVFMSLMKPEVSDHEHPLHDFYYDEAETIYGTNLPFMRAATLPEFVYQAFGFWRKDLIKAMTKATARSIIWVSWFRDGLTPDQTVRVLNHYAENPLSPYDMPLLEHALVRRIVRDIQNPTTLFNLAMGKRALDLEKNHMLSVFWADGLGDMNVKVNGWEGLYDVAMRASVEQLRGYNADVPTGFLMLEGIEDAGYKAHILHDADDYYMTGKVMDVCVGSRRFLKAAHEGEAVHVRFDRGGKMAALLDLRKEKDTNVYRIQEFKGPSNQEVPDRITLLDLVAQNTQYELIEA